MTVKLDLENLLEAMEWVTVGRQAGVDAEAYVRRSDGDVLWFGEGIDDLPPEDIENKEAYVAVPTERDFDLGSHVAIDYARKHLPGSLERVQDIFRRSGGYSRFKSLLDSLDHLDKWHAYEDAARKQALAQWCEDNGFMASRKICSVE